MKTVKVTGHPRLYRRGARYYHRAAIPQDIKGTYPKTEETFSLGTYDYREAVRRVRKAATEVDQRFDEHRRKLAAASQPIDSLSAAQIDQLAWSYYYVHYLAEEERQRREFDWDGHLDFDALYEALHDDLEKAARLYSLGRVDDRFQRIATELVEEAFSSPLAPGSPSWNDLTWKLQEAFIRAVKDILARQRGGTDTYPTGCRNAHSWGLPTAPCLLSTAPPASSSKRQPWPLLSAVVEEWLVEKARDWTPKTLNDHRITLRLTAIGLWQGRRSCLQGGAAQAAAELEQTAAAPGAVH